MTHTPQELLILNETAVAQLLPLPEAVRVMEDALVALARGQAVQPLRSVLTTADGAGSLLLMPAHLQVNEQNSALGFKAVTIFNGNAARGLETHYGAMLLLEADTGRFLALLNGTALTAIRTAAVSAVSAKYLARAEASTLALIGSGVQARAHLAALRCVRPLARVNVWSRQQEHARACAVGLSAQYQLPITACATAEEAVCNADIIVTATSAPAPVVNGEWLAPGAHIIAVGSSRATVRELDTRAVVNSLLFVDAREAALQEAGDVLIPISEGAVTAAHIQATLGEVLTGVHIGRSNATDITLFKSLGLAIEDVAAAHFVYQCALATGAGVRVSF